MRWTFKKNFENAEIIEIGYSHGNNEKCDGVIIYEKSTNTLNVKKHSQGCDEYDSKRTYQFIYGLLDTGNLSFEKYIICTG